FLPSEQQPSAVSAPKSATQVEGHKMAQAANAAAQITGSSNKTTLPFATDINKIASLSYVTRPNISSSSITGPTSQQQQQQAKTVSSGQDSNNKGGPLPLFHANVVYSNPNGCAVLGHTNCPSYKDVQLDYSGSTDDDGKMLSLPPCS